MLLGLSFSGLDKLGHIYGPDSCETIDYLYHFDKQLELFISYAKHTVGKKNFFLVLKADHGVTPIPEVATKKGILLKRVIAKDLQEELNKKIEEMYGVKDSPYTRDSHVPLILYGPKRFRSRYVYEKVSIFQLASTLAFLFKVEIPSAACK